MRTRTVVIGVVILVIGVALLGAGAVGALGSLTINRNFTEPHPGEFVSAEIVLNSSSVLVVASPASLGGVVTAQNLPQVNSTNISSLAVQASGSNTYRGLVGDYYYVAFASSAPSTTIVATPTTGGILKYGALALAGLLFIVVGIIVAIVGAVQKKKLPMQQP
jgi:hypothetical protein